MSNVRPDRSSTAAPAGLIRSAGLVLALVLLLSLTGCRLLPGEEDPVATRVGARTATVEELTGLLEQRARAVRRGDRAAYLRTVGRGRPRARRVQLRLFDNLQELPLARFGYRLDPATVVRTEDGVVAEVATVLQLDGFDAVPVAKPDLVRFGRSGPGRRFRVTAHRDAAWSRERGLALQPWEVARTEVRSGDGVLVVSDEATAARTDGLVAAVQRAAADVAPLVPFAWDRSVVVYALGDTRMLAGLADVPGGDPEQLDGVSVPFRSRGLRGRLASTRVVLHPRMLDRGATERDRLLRHELVHVALAARDDTVPTWLAEGIAEWASAQALPVQERTIARSAVAVAREGIDALPDDATFNGPRSGANYGVAWWAVEHVVATYGEDTLWVLFDRFREAARRSGADAVATDVVLLDVLGLAEAQLASAAGRRIVTTFG